MNKLPTLFAALADDTRFAIVERLIERGPTPAGDLADIARISAPAISRHLRILREAGVVHQRIDGQRRIYSVKPDSIRAISDWTIGRRAFWDGSLDRLEAAINSRRKE